MSSRKQKKNRMYDRWVHKKDSPSMSHLMAFEKLTNWAIN